MYRSYLVMHASLYHGIHDFSALYHCINSIIALYCCIIALYHCITVSLHCITVQCSAVQHAGGRQGAMRICLHRGVVQHAGHARGRQGHIHMLCTCLPNWAHSTLLRVHVCVRLSDHGTIELSHACVRCWLYVVCSHFGSIHASRPLLRGPLS